MHRKTHSHFNFFNPAIISPEKYVKLNLCDEKKNSSSYSMDQFHKELQNSEKRKLHKNSEVLSQVKPIPFKKIENLP